MSKSKPSTARSQKMLEKVYLTMGSHKIHERWILPYKEGRDWVSVQGLAEPGVITVSGLALVKVLLHEILHRVYPENTNEDSIERLTSYLYWRMSDDDARRLYDTYMAKVKRISKPTSSVDKE